MPSITGKHGRRIDKCSLFIIFVVLSSLTVSIATLFICLQHQRHDSGLKPSIMCVSCNSVKYAGELDAPREMYSGLRKVKDDESGEEKCCAETKKQATDLVKLVSMKLSIKHSPLKNPSPLTSALSDHTGMKGSQEKDLVFAQKSLVCLDTDYKRPDVPEIEDGKTVIMNIDPDNRSRYELSRGVQLTKYGIKIQHTGVYFVYKSINFLPDHNEPCGKFNGQTFESLLIRNNTEENYLTVLVKNLHTCCMNCVHNSETGFSGGVFDLTKGDIIQVNVTGLSLINTSNDVTYVGLMKMGW